MTTGGEGGMVTTNDRELWRRMWEYKDHGKSWEAVYEREHPPGFRWLHESFGTNWRMNEMQGVIGRLQVQSMPAWHAARLSNATRLWDACRETGWLRVPAVPEDVEHGAYKAYAFVEPDAAAGGLGPRPRRRAIVAELGVPCYAGSCSEVYLEKAFDGTTFRPPERLPVARELGETSVMFLVHPTLTEAEIERTVEVIGEVGRRIGGRRIGGRRSSAA